MVCYQDKKKFSAMMANNKLSQLQRKGNLTGKKLLPLSQNYLKMKVGFYI